MIAHAIVWDRDKCLVSGMDGYITKPKQAEESFAVSENSKEKESQQFLDAQNRRERKQRRVLRNWKKPDRWSRREQHFPCLCGHLLPTP